MQTARVDICYRPLRIAFAIHSGDRDSLRRAIKLSHTLWGGRFNPVVFADRAEEARALIELFRVDHIVSLGASPEVSAFRGKFPHLLKPFFQDELILNRGGGRANAQVLDVINALTFWREKPDWIDTKGRGFFRITWDEDDPLADAFLMQYGAYPDAAQVGIDYAAVFTEATGAVELKIDKNTAIPKELLDRPAISYLTRHAIKRHYAVRAGRSYPGFFVGDSNSIDDLVAFWNLRAADILLSFVDLSHRDRYARLMPALVTAYREQVAGRPVWERRVAIWSLDERKIEEAKPLFGEANFLPVHVSAIIWNGLNVRPPMMMLGDASALGVLGQSSGRTTASFTLNDKPFKGDNWFHTQHLVASMDISGTVGEQDVFRLPYLPELNEAASRSMIFEYNKLRIEPGRIGVVIDAVDHALTLSAYPVSELIEKTFSLAKLKAAPSSGGLIARQLIARLGGYDGARVFKVPGARRLIKTHNPNAPFTKKTALQLIGERDPKTGASFKDHEDLYIEQRTAKKLTPQMVFEYLVEKGLFRIGTELSCPSCNLPNWIPLDSLRQANTCDLCGGTFDATRQLIRGEFHYRRTGVLGIEKNAQGAIPVALLLQQLQVNLSGISGNLIQSPSYNLTPFEGVDLPVCETDFVVIFNQTYPQKPALIIGECKDEGDRIDARDIENLRRIANAIPTHRFDAYVLLARLSPFSDEEIALAKTLNDDFHKRAIMLSARELEPYHIYERVKRELNIEVHSYSPEELAKATAQIYFAPPARHQDDASAPVIDAAPGV
jgi:hypothetical protein